MDDLSLKPGSALFGGLLHVFFGGRRRFGFGGCLGFSFGGRVLIDLGGRDRGGLGSGGLDSFDDRTRSLSSR